MAMRAVVGALLGFSQQPRILETRSTMTPAEFHDGVLQALVNDGEPALAELVASYQPTGVESPNNQENDALIAIGKFGCSGRVNRYCAYIKQLLANNLRANLISCAYLRLFDEAKLAVERSRDSLNSPNKSGIHPLHAAAERGDLEMVRWLCELGADATRKTTKGELPITLALHAGPWKKEPAYDVAEYLAPRSNVAEQLWFLAASGNATALKEALIDPQVDVEDPGVSGATPLFHACHNNHLLNLQLLLAAGAKAMPAMLDTACLHYLSGECDPAIVTALIDAGVPRTLEAGILEDDVEFIEKHFEYITEPKRSEKLTTGLEYAVHSKAPRALATLIRLGARPRERTWLHIERIFNDDEPYLEALRELVQTGKSP